VLVPLKRANLNQWTALSKGPNRVGVFLHSPEDAKGFGLRNIVFSSCLEFRTLDKVHKHSDSENLKRTGG
jgi:hypothetical protein